ncbi:DUF5320 family protein [Desulfobotulus sp. H1]|uniref:DUF5320 family protein n=1 Tax=Desulfobotulus pelophilus TaxID=2823377 RepID=A0ABT3N7J7_9BACT|nr:DUF5320 family protein [Desulfobotulus pelophilus]MCW7753136.1 DUF5320 family protein [Desulfobotulus pelophilus]
MPGMNGQGPAGMGSRPGRGLGPCGLGKRKDEMREGLAQTGTLQGGRGMGGRRGSRRFCRGAGYGGPAVPEPSSSSGPDEV